MSSRRSLSRENSLEFLERYRYPRRSDRQNDTLNYWSSSKVRQEPYRRKEVPEFNFEQESNPSLVLESEASSSSEDECPAFIEPYSYQKPKYDKQIQVGTEYFRLRGADETYRAIQHDFITSILCPCCESTLLAIADADFVLCPQCRVVSPLRESPSHGGVGLGFLLEDLTEDQAELARRP